jgi:hypothetical protein
MQPPSSGLNPENVGCTCLRNDVPTQKTIILKDTDVKTPNLNINTIGPYSRLESDQGSTLRMEAVRSSEMVSQPRIP